MDLPACPGCSSVQHTEQLWRDVAVTGVGSKRLLLSVLTMADAHGTREAKGAGDYEWPSSSRCGTLHL